MKDKYKIRSLDYAAMFLWALVLLGTIALLK